LSAGLEEFLASIDSQAPRLRAQQAMLDSRAVGIERSKKEYRPDFAFSFQWQKTGGPFPDYYMATAEVKVPLYFWRKQRLGVEEAAARFQEARQSYASARQELVFMIKDLYLTASTSERLLALYQSGIIPQASLSLESAVAGYEVGSIDFLTLMSNFMSLLTYEMQYYEELAKHEQALARLEALVARPLTQP
jgi:outer membrane protein TolC